MPWTFAHPAAVLPFRNRLPLCALVVGSITPDLGYYIGQFGFATRSHALFEGLFLCIGIGLMVLLLLQLLKPAVGNILPQPHRGMLDAQVLSPFVSIAATGLTILALAVGALTHMLWDGFTHASGWFVAQLPALQTELVLDSGRPTPVYKILQHASSALGIAVLAIAYVLSLRRTPGYPWPRSARGQRWRITLLAVLACASLLMAAAWLVNDGGDRSAAAFIFHFVLVSTTVFSVLFIGAAFVLRHRLPD